MRVSARARARVPRANAAAMIRRFNSTWPTPQRRQGGGDSGHARGLRDSPRGRMRRPNNSSLRSGQTSRNPQAH
eukprot:3022678-Pyramimonas_sp.AAC.1